MEKGEIDALLDQAYACRGSDIHHSIRLTRQALQHCHDTQYTEGKAKAENQLSLFHLVQGDFSTARDLAESALQYFTECKNLKGIADAHYNLGSIHYRTDNYHKGLQLMLECLKAYR